jgi:hypothetical protein
LLLVVLLVLLGTIRAEPVELQVLVKAVFFLRRLPGVKVVFPHLTLLHLWLGAAELVELELTELF